MTTIKTINHKRPIHDSLKNLKAPMFKKLWNDETQEDVLFVPLSISQLYYPKLHLSEVIENMEGQELYFAMVVTNNQNKATRVIKPTRVKVQVTKIVDTRTYSIPMLYKVNDKGAMAKTPIVSATAHLRGERLQNMVFATTEEKCQELFEAIAEYNLSYVALRAPELLTDAEEKIGVKLV